MKKLMTALTAVAIAAVIALPVQAGDKAEKKQKDSNKQFTGIVNSMDSEKGTLVVAKKQETKTFTCNADTKYRLASKEAGTAADIKQGLKVQVEYVAQGETAVAKKVAIVPAKEKKDKEEKKSE
jgi:hypothetical protein